MMSRNGLLQRLLRVMLATVMPVFATHLTVQLASDVDAAKLRAFRATESIASATLPLLQGALVAGDLSTVQDTLDRIMSHGQFKRLDLVARGSGELLAFGYGPPSVSSRLSAPVWMHSLLDVHFETQRFPVQVGGVEYGILIAEPSSAFLVEDLWRRLWTAAVLWAATLLILLFLFKRALRSGLRPLHDLAIAVRRFGEGERAVRAPSCDVPELAVTARAFNQMADRLEESQDELEARVRQRTAELAAREAHTSAILRSLHDGVLQVGPDGLVLMANPAACRMFGLSEEAMRGQPLHELLPDVPTAYPDLPRQGQTDPRSFETHAVQRPDKRIPVEYSVAPLAIGDEGSLVIVLRDITEQREIENAREAARSNAERLARARSEFLANMSHEIRTPLNAILGFAQIGLRKGPSGPFAESFGHILHSGELLLGLINDVLDFSKIEARRVQMETSEFDLGEVLDRAVEVTSGQARQKGLAFVVSEAGDLPARVLGDPFRLTQVLVNLLSNAIKFTPAGRIGLEASGVPGALCFRISDTGVGMSPAVVARLFTPFEQADSSITRRFGGTGLGLVISHRLVELMGGGIEVDSRPGHGTTMTVRVPLAAEPVEPRRVMLPPLALVGFSADERATLLIGVPPDLRVVEPAEAAVWLVPEVGVTKVIAGGSPALVILDMPDSARVTTVNARVKGHIGWPLRWRQVRELLEASADGPEGPVVAPSPSLAGLRILAAEDDPANRLVLQEILEMAGARLVMEENGAAACARFRRDGRNAYDLVITDLQMPLMDGYATAREIRRMAPGLPVIGLSAHVLPEERAQCLAAGMIELLTKPVSVDLLLATLAQLGAVTAMGEAHSRPQTPSTGDLVDWSRLEQCFARVDGFIERLAETVRNDAFSLLAELRAAAREGDVETLARVSHRIAGMAANFMATGLQEQARAVELAVRAGDLDAAGRALELAGQVDHLLVEIDRRVPRSAPAMPDAMDVA